MANRVHIYWDVLCHTFDDFRNSPVFLYGFVLDTVRCCYSAINFVTVKKKRCCTSHGYYKRLWTWWRHQMETFPRYWPFVWGFHRSPVNSHHKGQWRGALMFSLICAWINGWVNNGEAGDLRRHRTHYDVTVMKTWDSVSCQLKGVHNGNSNGVMLPSPSLTIYIDGSWGPFYKHGLTLILACISNYIHYKVWEWISNFGPYLTGHVITYQCWD